METHSKETKPASGTVAHFCRDWRVQISAWLLICLSLAGGWMLLRLRDPARASRPFRIGFQQSPPYQYVAANGTPAGPAVEIVAEAARRRHIPFEWILSPEGPEPNLKSGKVDLWPLLADLPERHKFLYISHPWLTNSFWLATLETSDISTPKDTVGRSVLHLNVSATNRLAQAYFPGARLVPQPTNIAAMEGLCSGKADAAMIGGSNADAAGLRDLPVCRGAHMKFYPLPNGIVNYGIGASFQRPDASRAADAIREEIGKMSRDGTVSAVYFRWFKDPSNDTSVIYYLTEAQQRNLYLLVGLCALTLLLVLFGWQTFRLRDARSAADRLNSNLKEASAELAAANLELKEASLTDPLTRLHNRRFFQVMIEAEVTQSLRQYSEPSQDNFEMRVNFPNRDIVFYIVDIDHFKNVNDIYGHPRGDVLLIEAAQRINAAMRKSDTLIRWGGEEFLVVSFPTERGKAETLAQRIMSSFSERSFNLGDSIHIHKTCSVGWAPFPWFVREPTALDYDEVLKLADRALYMAKESGRNCAVGLIPASVEAEYNPAPAEATNGRLSESDRVAVQSIHTAGPAVEVSN